MDFSATQSWRISPIIRRLGFCGRAGCCFHTRPFGGASQKWYGIRGALALLAVPLWWRSRAARFCYLVFTAVAWFFMASTRDAERHCITLCCCGPFRNFSAIAISALPANGWRDRSQRCGDPEPAGAQPVSLSIRAQWSCARSFQRRDLSAFGGSCGPSGQTVYVLDWGIQFPLDVLHNGRLHMAGARGGYGQCAFRLGPPGGCAHFRRSNRGICRAYGKTREFYGGPGTLRSGGGRSGVP